MLGIASEGPGDAGSDQLLGGKNGMDQRLNSVWVGGSVLQKLAGRDGGQRGRERRLESGA